MVVAMAEFERSVISERTKAGMAAARRRGWHVGRPAKLTPDQLDYARRMIVEGEGSASRAVAWCRSLDVAAAVDEGLKPVMATPKIINFCRQKQCREPLNEW
jgi:hypothetical protein